MPRSKAIAAHGLGVLMALPLPKYISGLTHWAAVACVFTFLAGSVLANDLEAMHRAAPGLTQSVLAEALDAIRCAESRGAASANTLTVIDYSLPSTQARLWSFDLQSGALLFHEWVAHGQGSGENLANHFSNVSGSRKSSLGLFRTAETYVGRNGYSLRLDGLQIGINDQARPRAIVMHGADYVHERFVQRHGRLGRSWGCPAVRQEVARELMDRIKQSGWLYVYHPSRIAMNCDAASIVIR